MSRRPPLYVRTLRLRHVRPGGLLCFLYFEGAIGLGVLLALAELAPWWGTLALPAAVAAMVKINDVVAGTAPRRPVVPADGVRGPTPLIRASVPMARTAGPTGIAAANLAVTGRRPASSRWPFARPHRPTSAAGSMVPRSSARPGGSGASGPPVGAGPLRRVPERRAEYHPRGPNQGRFDWPE